jgi:hypothetical protein
MLLGLRHLLVVYAFVIDVPGILPFTYRSENVLRILQFGESVRITWCLCMYVLSCSILSPVSESIYSLEVRSFSLHVVYPNPCDQITLLDYVYHNFQNCLNWDGFNNGSHPPSDNLCLQFVLLIYQLNAWIPNLDRTSFELFQMNIHVTYAPPSLLWSWAQSGIVVVTKLVVCLLWNKMITRIRQHTTP